MITSGHAPRYDDRHHAGRVLADLLTGHPLLAGGPPPTVLRLPRGGALVAPPGGAPLHSPLDAIVVRKLGLPGRPELEMGAVAAVVGRLEVVGNHAVLARARVPDAELDAVVSREVAELRPRDVDDLVCPWMPRPFHAVGQAYADFSPTSDDEVQEALRGHPG